MPPRPSLRFTAMRRCWPARAGASMLLVAALLLAGCASSGSTASPPGRPDAEAEVRAPARVASALRAETQSWEGTPYRFGGTTPRGVDCSAFTQHLYRDVLGVAIPRTTHTQVDEGKRIAKSRLRPGDLVFFRPARKTRHVGVYVGEGEFAHASTSQGVTISPLGADYWREAYWTARRVLSVAPAAPRSPSPAGAPARAEAPARPPDRTGW